MVLPDRRPAAASTTCAPHPYFKDREIVPLCFAHEGYKQPQQALVLAYFLSIGQAYDLVVNIDGFNDVALAALNNEQGLDISMPSVQHLDPLIALVNRSALTPEKLESLAAIFRDRQTLDGPGRADCGEPQRGGERRARLVLRARVGTLQPGARTVQQPAGEPARECADPGHARRRRSAKVRRSSRDIADMWSGASLLMDQMVEARGGAYFHVLQPNQYSTTRRFGAAEAATALNDGVAVQDQY